MYLCLTACLQIPQTWWGARVRSAGLKRNTKQGGVSDGIEL